MTLLGRHSVCIPTPHINRRIDGRVPRDGDCLLRCVWAILISLGIIDAGIDFDRELFFEFINAIVFQRHQSLRNEFLSRLNEFGISSSEWQSIIRRPWATEEGYTQFSIYTTLMTVFFGISFLANRQNPHSVFFRLVNDRNVHYNLDSDNPHISPEAVQWLGREMRRFEAVCEVDKDASLCFALQMEEENRRLKMTEETCNDAEIARILQDSFV